MATKEMILSVLSGASAPMSASAISEKLGEPISNFKTQLDRFIKQGLLEVNDQKEYSLTDAGRDEALKGSEEEASVSEETLGTTEYQQFIKFAKVTGITPLPLIEQLAEHIWSGGDFRDLSWVARALQEMGIRRDLAGRLYHRWRSYLHQPIPEDVPIDFLPGKAEKAEAKEGVHAKGKRDYILGENDTPVYVGEGVGDMDHDEAFELAKIKSAARARAPAAPANQESGLDQLEKVLKIAKELQGKEDSAGKSYVIKQGEKGYEAEELDPKKPVVINPLPGAGDNRNPIWILNNETGELKEAKPGEPITLQPRQTPGKSYMLNQETGQLEELTPGKPVVIHHYEKQSGGFQGTPIQLKDKDGNPIVLDLDTFIRLEEHKSKTRRDDEKHEAVMEITSEFKKMVSNAGRALGHMAEEKE